jgi:hypothetical protein
VTQLPLSVDDLNMWALEYVGRLLGRGYTVERASQETAWGCFGPGEPGFEIRKGIICVGFWGKEKKGANRFRFSDVKAKLDALVELTKAPVQEVLL